MTVWACVACSGNGNGSSNLKKKHKKHKKNKKETLEARAAREVARRKHQQCSITTQLSSKEIKMEKLINTFNQSVQSFAKDEEGAQVVEYALIIAVVSIGLVVALGSSTSGLRSSFGTLVGRLTTCFTTGSTCS